LRVDHGRPGVPERAVHRVRERVDHGRLVLAGDDERAAAVGEQVFGDGLNPFRDRRAEALHHILSSPTRPT